METVHCTTTCHLGCGQTSTFLASEFKLYSWDTGSGHWYQFCCPLCDTWNLRVISARDYRRIVHEGEGHFQPVVLDQLEFSRWISEDFVRNQPLTPEQRDQLIWGVLHDGEFYTELFEFLEHFAIFSLEY